MSNYSEQDFRDFGDDQGLRWDEGFGVESLVHFLDSEGYPIVNPYSYTLGNPDEKFGQEKMESWRKEAEELMAEFEADAA